MTVGIITECLITTTDSQNSMTDAPSTYSAAASSSGPAKTLVISSPDSSATTTTTTTDNTSISQYQMPRAKTSDLSNANVTTTSSDGVGTASSVSHSIGAIKKARASPKGGRNHAGAKYLASQYTKGILN